MAATTLGTQAGTQRALACGEVGLLGEEGAQRLLSVFSEFASVCLHQIYEMSYSHGAEKCQALYKVGLDLVARWDGDVLHEETVRMETSYPEVPALHSFVYLWLLDRCFPDRDLLSLAVPPLPDAYAIFMRRVSQHADVAKGRAFIDNPEVFRRTIFIDAFRGAYHDLMQRKLREARAVPGVFARLAAPPSVTYDATVAPEDAASEVAARLAAQVACPSACARSAPSARSSPGSALQLAMAREAGAQGEGATAPPVRAEQQGEPPMHLPTALVSATAAQADALRACETTSALVPPSCGSDATRAVPVVGPCFFAVAEEESTGDASA